MDLVGGDRLRSALVGQSLALKRIRTIRAPTVSEALRC
jgi:hypothetical protein